VEAHINWGSALASMAGPAGGRDWRVSGGAQEEPIPAEAHNNLGSALAQTPDHLATRSPNMRPHCGSSPTTRKPTRTWETPCGVSSTYPGSDVEYEAALRNEPILRKRTIISVSRCRRLTAGHRKRSPSFKRRYGSTRTTPRPIATWGSSCPMLRAVYRKRFPTLKRRFDSGPIMPMRTTIWEPPCRTYRPDA